MAHIETQPKRNCVNGYEVRGTILPKRNCTIMFPTYTMVSYRSGSCIVTMYIY